MDSRIQLPSDIYHLVLSYLNLTNEELVRLSLVSKELSSIIQTRPALVFNHNLINFEKYDTVIECRKRYLEELSYILSTLATYQEQDTHLHTFIFVPLVGSSGRAHDLCIRMALKRRLKYLNLYMQRSYRLPRDLFEVESLVELSLTDCGLQRPRTTVWPNLRRLYLDGVAMEDEGVFENMMRGSPLLEELKINKCCENSLNFNFQVSDLRYLKKLGARLSGCQTLQVKNAATRLDYICCICGRLDLDESKYENLKSLWLYCTMVDDKFFANLANKFPHLEYLCIQNTTLRRIKISSSSLKRIRVDASGALREACFDVPNIDAFQFYNHSYGETSTSIPNLSFAGNPSGWISEIQLVECNDHHINIFWFHKLNEFLEALKGSKTLMDVRIEETRRSVEEFYLSFSGTIREFPKVASYTTFTLSSAKLYVSDSLWKWPPETITFQNWSNFLTTLFNEVECSTSF